MVSPVQFVRTADGVNVAYCEHGDGPPLVFVRGWISHLERMWDLKDFRAFIQALAARFRVIRFDNRANGLSDLDVPAPTLDSLVLDLEAVVDRLGLERFDLYGSTFGGHIALAYAAKHHERVSRLVVDNVYARGQELAPKDQRDALLNMLRTMPRPAAHVLSLMTSPERAGASIEGSLRSISDKGVVDLYTLAYELDLTPILPAITVPTLVMHRRETATIPLELGRRLAAQVSGARFVALDGKSLNLYEGDATPALRAIGDFLGADLVSGYSRPPEASPSRPLTILFTDMEGSTALTTRMGDAAAQETLRTHDRLVRDCLRAHHGREVKHTGDGIMASFESASEALDCAVEIQKGLAAYNQDNDAPIRVRIALNSGEPVAENKDLFGTSVQTAARILEETDPGQIRVANVVRELVAGKGFSFRPLGQFNLRGLDEPVSLYEVNWHS
jgi:class 3 adenylate cyclase